MSAREGWAERLGDGVQGWPDSIEKLLDSVRQRVLAEDHHQQKRGDPAARSMDVFEDRENDRERYYQERVTEMGDPRKPPFETGPAWSAPHARHLRRCRRAASWCERDRRTPQDESSQEHQPEAIVSARPVATSGFNLLLIVRRSRL